MKKILLLAPERPGPFSSGPSRRICQLQELLQSHFEVGTSYEIPPLAELNKWDFIYVNAALLPDCALVKKSSARLVIDLYVPFFFEHHVRYSGRPESELRERVFIDKAILFDALQSGDVFLTAARRQTDLYTGLLYLLREPHNLCSPLTLPFFLRSGKTASGEKSVSDNQDSDFRVAWIGGFWDWFQPEPFLDILPRLMGEAPSLKALFIGLEHPFHRELTSSCPALSRVRELEKLFPGRIKVFPWLPYQEYLEMLAEIDLAVVLHKNSLEADYSMRTRFIEILENRVPLFCSEGGELSEKLRQYGLGRIIDNNSAEVLYREILAFLKNPKQLSGDYDSFAAIYDFATLQKNLTGVLNAADKLPQRHKSFRKSPYLRMGLSSFYYLYYRVRRKLYKIMGRFL
jgi:glycosyltransferase involved in cell wall biosynthesis